MKIQKPIYAFLILLLLTAVFAVVIYMVASNEISEREDARIRLKIDGVAKTLDTLEIEIKDAVDKNDRRHDALMQLMSLLLKPFIKNGRYEGPEVFEDGFVVRIDGDRVIYPEGQKRISGLDAKTVKRGTLTLRGDPSGYEQIRLAEIRSIPIDGSYYYIDLTDDDEVLDSVLETVRLRETINDIEKSYNCQILISVLPDPDQNIGEYPEVPFEFLISPTGTDFAGLTPEEVGIDINFLSERPGTFKYGGKIFRCDYDIIKYLEYEYLVIILNSVEKDYAYLLNSILLYVSVILIAGVGIILWLYWVQTYVRDNELLPAQMFAYKPRIVRKRVKAVILVGGIGIFLIAVFFQSLNNLNREALSNREALNTVMGRLNKYTELVSANQVEDEEWAVYFAKRIASIIKESDDLWSKEYITKANDLIGSQYIMLFDTEGDNILSSNALVRYSLTETESLLEFADLIKGIPIIIGKPKTDMITGKKSQLIGVSIPYENERLFAALIMSVDVDNSWGGDDERMLREFLENATPVGNLCVVISKENDTVVYSSDPEFIGDIIPGLNYRDGRPEKSDLDTYKISSSLYYGAYDSNEKYVVYYLTESSYVQGKSVLYAFAASLGFMTIIFLVSWFMLYPYTSERYKAYARLKESDRHSDIIETERLDDLFEKGEDDTPVKLKDRWKNLVPENRIRLFLQVFLGIIMLLSIIYHFSSENAQLFSTRSTMDFILNGNWTRGLNLLGFAGTLVVIISFAAFIFLKNILLNILCAVLDPKGETICRLAFSLLQYIAVLGGIYLIMGFLGFNTSFQLTSVGIISLAISLGSKDIVADILAGIFIIFEGDFQVGDFVNINGFQGVVQEIGVRSTKILGLGDNIKIIGNQDVKNVLNLSKMNTWLTLEYKLPRDIPLLEVEALLEKELPEIGKRIPEMISGPYYKGVWTVNDEGKKIIHISCECTEKHSRTVQRKLNHEMILLLEENGYIL